MKILFAIPPFTVLHSTVPYGISMVASVAKKAGLNIHMHLPFGHMTLDSYEKSLVNKIKDEQFDVVCFGGLSTYYSKIKRLIDVCKKLNVITILGGNIISATPELVIQNIGSDYGVIGEGENTFKELIYMLCYGKTMPSMIDGLIYKLGDEIIKTKPRAEICNLDSLPYIDDELIDFEYTIKNTHKFFMCATRSCPYNCTFCYHHKPDYRERSMDHLFGEIDYLISKYDKYGIKEIGFIDDVFYTDEEKIFDFCAKIEKYNKKIQIVNSRADGYNEEMLRRLKTAGCYYIGYGVESASNKILKSLNKQLTIEKINHQIDLTNKVGIDCQVGIILGDVEDDWKTMNDSIDWAVQRTRNNQVNISPLMVLPNSKLYQHAVKNKIIKDELTFLEQGCPTVNVSKLTDDQYELLLSKIVNADKGKVWAHNVPLDRQWTHGIPNYSFNLHTDGTIDYTCYCSKCMNKLEYKNLIRQNILYKPHSMYFDKCPNCLNRVGFELSDLIAHRPENNLIGFLADEYFSKYDDQKIVICGMTNEIRSLLFESQVLRNCLRTIVDPWPERYMNERYCGINVHPIDFIGYTNFVYLMFGSNEAEREVIKKFPAVVTYKQIKMFKGRV